jgi:hypothetical protein
VGTRRRLRQHGRQDPGVTALAALLDDHQAEKLTGLWRDLLT